jgi:hypothetical protein
MRTLIEVDEFTSDVQVPEDGDPRNAASLVAFQSLANRAKYLKAALESGDSALADRLDILEQFQQITLSGSDLERGDYLTMASAVGSSGFSLGDSDKKLIVPAAADIYFVTIMALITLDSSLADDTSYLKIHSTTSGDITLTTSYGARCDFAPGVMFVHHMSALCNGDIYVKWGTVANTDRTADITFGVMTVRRLGPAS